MENNCNPYFDTCNEDGGLSVEQMIRILMRKDSSGCPALPIVGQVWKKLNTESVKIIRPNSTTSGGVYEYGLVNQRPVLSNNSGASVEVAISPDIDQKAFLSSGSFSIASANPNAGFVGRIHFFKDRIIMPNDDNSFNPAPAELAHYLGSADFNVKGVTSNSIYGELDFRPGLLLIPESGTKNVHFVVELSDSVELAPEAELQLNFVTEPQ